jgi:hypothetical protein
MKKLMVLSAIVAGGLISQSADAQGGFHINLHFGTQPVYEAPARFYEEQYYYLPEVEAYYSVREQCYYYNKGYNWVSAAYLPGAYRDYDWEHARRFEINEARPYMHNDVYRSRYGGFEHRDWNNREQYDNRMYADREHDQYRGHDDRGNYGRMQEPRRDNRFNNRREEQGPQGNYNYNRGQQQAQPQQNDNRNNGGYNRWQQQAQPQQNDYRGNGGFNRGQQQTQPQQNDNRYNQGQPTQQREGGNNGNNNGQQHFAENRSSAPVYARPTRF